LDSLSIFLNLHELTQLEKLELSGIECPSVAFSLNLKTVQLRDGCRTRDALAWLKMFEKHHTMENMIICVREKIKSSVLWCWLECTKMSAIVDLSCSSDVDANSIQIAPDGSLNAVLSELLRQGMAISFTYNYGRVMKKSVKQAILRDIKILHCAPKLFPFGDDI